jgi:enoyl-[acyl-carrier protein] reductase II
MGDGLAESGGPSPEAPPPLRTRVSELLGVDYPLIQAPMGFIARAQLASAVSNAGGFGIVETSSGRLDEVREEMAAMRDLTDRPWGVNIAQMLVADPHIVEFVAGQGVRFVTTSAGDPARYTDHLHEAGITVFHVVPSLRAAHKAVAAGVDGLVVEGGEGGGFKSTRPVSTFVLLPQICEAFDVPVIAAGGIVDGVSMAAAFALGAEGVQMGTRMVSAAESPVHENYKRLVTEADATDTVVLSAHSSPAYRVMRTPFSEGLEREPSVVMGRTVGMEGVLKLYFEGDLDAGFAFGGQAAGRIGEVLPVRQIVHETVRDFYGVVAALGRFVPAD